MLARTGRELHNSLRSGGLGPKLHAIEEFIALASGIPATAARFVDGIVAYCESFETFPERGAHRDDLLSGLRIVGYRKSVTIAFRVNTDSQVVSIFGVFYGGQDYEPVLAGAAPNEAERSTDVEALTSGADAGRRAARPRRRRPDWRAWIVGPRAFVRGQGLLRTAWIRGVSTRSDAVDGDACRPQ